jgi:hypothetical protein
MQLSKVTSTTITATSYNATVVPSDEQMSAIFDADKFRTLNYLFCAIVQTAVKFNLTLQQIEKALREKYCFTWMIARRIDGIFAQDVAITFPPGTGSQKTYYLFLTTRRYDFVNEELLEESKDYFENFKKLADTGMPSYSSDQPMSKTLLSGKFEITHAKLNQLTKEFIIKEYKIFMNLVAGSMDASSKIYNIPHEVIITIIKTLDAFEKYDMRKHLALTLYL